MFENKKIVLLILIIILIVGGLIGGFSLLKGRGGKETIQQLPPVEEKIESVSAEDLGLTLTARPDKKAVKFEITNPKGIASLDYDLSYLAKGEIPRGVIGHIDIKPQDKKIVSNYLDLGSCSRNVCKYDEGVTSVKLILKISKTDGKVLQAEKELEL